MRFWGILKDFEGIPLILRYLQEFYGIYKYFNSFWRISPVSKKIKTISMDFKEFQNILRAFKISVIEIELQGIPSDSKDFEGF